jgi:hypothetical protein
LEQGADLLEDARRSQQGILVGHSEDADATLAEECVAKSIASLAAGVWRAIDLDGKVGGHAEEVGEVRSDGPLAAKAVTIELASPEVLPERRFGGGGVVAVLAGEDRGARWRSTELMRSNDGTVLA